MRNRWLTVLVFLAGLSALMCNSPNEWDSNESLTSNPVGVSAPTASNEPTPAPVAEATPLPDGYWQRKVNFDPNGVLTIQSGDVDYAGEYCYFINGPHPQTRLFEGLTSVKAGAGIKAFSKPDLVKLWLNKKVNDTCDPLVVSLQADAGWQTFDCDNPSNQVADAGTNDLHAYKYFDITIPAGRERWPEFREMPGTRLVRRAKLQECPPPEPGDDVLPNVCYECWEIRTTYRETDNCEERPVTITTIEREVIPCPCKEWYPGTPPAERARITFMSKTTSGLYLWRLQNGTQLDKLTVRGPGFDQTFSIAPGTVGAFTTPVPYFGLSVFDCEGNRLHGTASANETVEPWCDWPELDTTECPVCDVPDVIGQRLPAEGNEFAECAAFGPYVPVCKTESADTFADSTITPPCRGDEALFYICKQATEMWAGTDYATVCGDSDWSHKTGCVCD